MKRLTTSALPLFYSAVCVLAPSCGKPSASSAPEAEARSAKPRDGVRPPNPPYRVDPVRVEKAADYQKGTLASEVDRIVQNTPQAEIGLKLMQLVQTLEMISDDQFRDLIGALPPGEISRGALNTLLSKMAVSDPRRLADLLTSMRASLPKLWYDSGMMLSASWNARNYGIDALTWIDSSDIPRQTKVTCLGMAMEILTKKEPNAVIGAVDSLSDDSVRNELMTKRPYADSLREANLPAEQVANRINSLPTAELRAILAYSVGKSFGEAINTLGLEALSRTEDPNILRDGFNSWFDASMKVDVNASLKALSAVPPEFKDQLVARLAPNIHGWDPASAEAWVNSISDPELRERTAASVFRK